jgi:hypothetical protein
MDLWEAKDFTCPQRFFLLQVHIKRRIYGTPIETEEGLLARVVAECGTIHNRPRKLETVRRSIFRSYNEDDGRHLGQLL